MKYIVPFSQLGIEDIPQVGGKNASLGEMYQRLTPLGIQIPNGFATTADAYRYYMRHNNLDKKVFQILSTLNRNDLGELALVGAKIRQWIIRGNMPHELHEQIVDWYDQMGAEYGKNPDVSVRSSATAEDLPDASFAGQQETYLNIRGRQNLIYTCKRVFASLFTDRAISYRIDKGFGHDEVALSIGIQKMVRSDLGTSGVMFTLDTESGFRDVVFINASYGLGENIVQGAVNPDEYYVFKPCLAQGYPCIVGKHLGDKAIKMVYGSDAMAGVSTRNVAVAAGDRRRFALDDEDILQLASAAVKIEQHYSDKAGLWRPMDIEWAKDGIDGKLYIVQARPETVQAQKPTNIYEAYHLSTTGQVLAQGKSVGNKIGQGTARVIHEAAHMNRLQPGEILITDMTDPDWEPIMKIAAAIVTNRGGRTCHAAIIARELGIPAIVGCGDATEKIMHGAAVTVSCAQGEQGYVYDGIIPFQKERLQIDLSRRPATKIYLNVANPETAFHVCQLPNDGVGLARMEFMINNTIGIHPNALLDYPELEDRSLTKKIHAAIRGYDDAVAYYVDKLVQGIARIAAAFFPKPVILRFSDFKSNEYAQLLGGTLYEPVEENPMLGFRGAGRYASPRFERAFRLELQAVKKVRETLGLKNLAVMIPFVRTVDEAQSVLTTMKQAGLEHGKEDLKIYMMCEIPANVILADEFLALFDGFSIGSNDLTQLTLGVDRDSGMITNADERDPAVLQLIKMAIESCHRHGKYVGICGQAPSDFPQIAYWLSDQGIDSISLNPDTVLKTSQLLLDHEDKRKSDS